MCVFHGAIFVTVNRFMWQTCFQLTVGDSEDSSPQVCACHDLSVKSLLRNHKSVFKKSEIVYTFLEYFFLEVKEKLLCWKGRFCLSQWG